MHDLITLPSTEHVQSFLNEHLHSLILFLLILLGIVFRRFIFVFFKKLKIRFERSAVFQHHEGGFLKKLLGSPLERPIGWMILLGVWLLFVDDATDLSDKMLRTLRVIFQVLLWLQIIWIAYFAADAAGEVIGQHAHEGAGSLHEQLAPLLTKTLKGISVILGVLLILQNVGVNVMSILAGLGIGGLAIALAAQDTCANLLGSVVIFLDHPFQIGDYIKILDVEGNVEEVGFRSTILRTPTETLITLPNSMIAREKIENYQLRHLRRIRFPISLSFASSIDKMTLYRDEVEKLLRQKDKIAKDSISVRLTEVTPGGVTISIIFFLEAASGDEELKMQEQILVEILAVSESVGVAYAYGAPAVLVKTKSDTH